MTRRERLEAAFQGRPVDRPPISFWQHFPGRDHDAALLAEATATYQRRFDLDFVKLMPTGMYAVMDYGVAVAPSGDAIGTTRYASGPIHAPTDWDRLPPASPARGVLGREVEAVRRVRQALGPDAPVVQTIFSPLTMAAKIAGMTGAAFAGCLRDDPTATALRGALGRLADDVVAFGRACVDAGADGFFFATQLAARGALPEGMYAEFGIPYDHQVLETLRPHAWALILHLHGEEPLFELADRYPVDAVNWHARETAPGLGAALGLTRRGLVGGIARLGPVLGGSPEDAVAEARDAIAQAGGRRLVVAPGCVLPTTAPEANLLALRRAVDT
jgi:uroporphyrinogen decarboxylase